MNDSSDNFAEKLNLLTDIAKKDGIISNDEEKLLRQMKISYDEYNQQLQKILKEGRVSKEKYECLKQFRDLQIKKNYEIANLDRKISQDEMRILIAFVVSFDLPEVADE